MFLRFPWAQPLIGATKHSPRSVLEQPWPRPGQVLPEQPGVRLAHCTRRSRELVSLLEAARKVWPQRPRRTGSSLPSIGPAVRPRQLRRAGDAAPFLSPAREREKEERMKSQVDRQGGRVTIAMPIQVFGTEITGQDFMEETSTQVLCRDGAAIVSSHRLAPMQQITVRNLATGAEASARIIGEMSARPESRVYGIALLDPESRLWNVNFPGSGDSEKARSQRWLECSACRGRELASLSTLECDVFQANRQLTRPCQWCGEDTVWHLAAHEASGDKRKLSEPPPKVLAQTSAQPSKERPSRKSARVHMKMTACVREPGFGVDDFVQVEDVSRTGLSFYSPNAYRQGALVEVAAPYMQGAENVFSLMRVQRVQAQPAKKLNLYGLNFVNKSGR